MINNQEDTKSRFNGVGNGLLYLLVGGGIGATIALLFAPKPGKELRHDVSEGVKYGLETANEKYSQVRETVGEKASQLKEVADDYYHKAQEKASKLYNVALKTVSDGTTEANALVGNPDAAKQAQEAVSEIQDHPANQDQSPPMFESGRKPLDQRNIKTGIL